MICHRLLQLPQGSRTGTRWTRARDCMWCGFSLSLACITQRPRVERVDGCDGLDGRAVAGCQKAKKASLDPKMGKKRRVCLYRCLVTTTTMGHERSGALTFLSTSAPLPLSSLHAPLPLFLSPSASLQTTPTTTTPTAACDYLALHP